MKHTTTTKTTPFWVLALFIFILLGRLTVQAADGSLDTGFTPSVPGPVYGTAVQPYETPDVDFGMILVGGNNYLARFTPYTSGPADDTFTATNVNNRVYCVAVQADGKVLVGGEFYKVDNGTTNSYLVRLNADGSLDSTFTNSSPDSQVYCIAVQTNGQILIGGIFSSVIVGGVTNSYISVARLNTDGSVDTNFANRYVSNANNVNSMALQTDGKIVIGGGFTTVGGLNYKYVARLNPDGTVDSTFSNPNVSGSPGNSQVNSVMIQADGKILIGGSFSSVSVGGVTYTYNSVARLNTDGTVDTSFSNPSANGSVLSMAAQTDGKVLIAGAFTTLFGTTHNRIARLNANGTVDTNFIASANGTVTGVTLEADGLFDGWILIGGNFTTSVNPNFARLINNSPASQTLSVPNTTQVQWLRSGTEPEVSFVTFESSTDNGTNWTALGNGSRISGGWQLTGLSLPSSSVSIRARGRFASGYSNGSSSLIEQTNTFTNISTVLPPVKITTVYSAGKLILSWTSGIGTLQSGPVVGGPYTNVPGASSPYTNNNLTLPKLFYRVKVQ
jgi:uncharacterized delta-60 repeat protein